MGQRAITNLLNDEHVPSPRTLYYRDKGRDNPCRNNGLWNKETIKSILNNECYLGNLVQGKKGTVSYKNHKLVNKAEELWIRVEGTHEPLVSREDWETVRSLDNRNFKPRTDSEGMVHLFTGLLRCADCDYNLRAHVTRDTRKDGTQLRRDNYICGNYARSGKVACTLHSIKESVLIQLVSDETRSHAAFIAFDKQRVVKAIMQGKDRESVSLDALHRKQLHLSESRLTELDRIIRMLYEDRVNGVITDVMFKEMTAAYESERNEKNAEISELRAKIERCDQDACDVNAWIQAIVKYSELTELTREILIELINNIEVFEPERIDKQRVCRIRIHYRFVGAVGEALIAERGEILERAI